MTLVKGGKFECCISGGAGGGGLQLLLLNEREAETIVGRVQLLECEEVRSGAGSGARLPVETYCFPG